jgi:hypothetical protein
VYHTNYVTGLYSLLFALQEEANKILLVLNPTHPMFSLNMMLQEMQTVKEQTCLVTRDKDVEKSERLMLMGILS